MKENNNKTVVSVKDLCVHYETHEGIVEAVNGVSFDIKKGECLGLVGETGAGKTTIALSIMNLLPHPPAHVIEGNIDLDGEKILSTDENGKVTEKSTKEMLKIRGKKVSMIFQDPMTALNPVRFVGDQIAEVIQLHEHCSPKDAMLRACEMMEKVGIMPERYKEYPHQFSGGMKQRIVIAIALACKPDLLLADEPTTALDVTIQAQVLDMMRTLQKEQETATLMITHDLGIVAEMCDKCAIIYAGQIVEYGTLAHIFDNPLHPYTIGLMDSIPSLDKDVHRLTPIPGMVADPMDLPCYCSFADRCIKCRENCRQGDPELIEVEPGHWVRCFQYQMKKGAL
ncbi:MAG: ABC transporter ATP-binding protein [Lachnospiraceae bacterium]|nr:ABC transporter ATP-binding protein [Lachnospiraceae bacterium]